MLAQDYHPHGMCEGEHDWHAGRRLRQSPRHDMPTRYRLNPRMYKRFCMDLMRKRPVSKWICYTELLFELWGCSVILFQNLLVGLVQFQHKQASSKNSRKSVRKNQNTSSPRLPLSTLMVTCQKRCCCWRWRATCERRRLAWMGGGGRRLNLHGHAEKEPVAICKRMIPLPLLQWILDPFLPRFCA